MIDATGSHNDHMIGRSSSWLPITNRNQELLVTAWSKCWEGAAKNLRPLWTYMFGRLVLRPTQREGNNMFLKCLLKITEGHLKDYFSLEAIIFHNEPVLLTIVYQLIENHLITPAQA